MKGVHKDLMQAAIYYCHEYKICPTGPHEPGK